MGIINDIKRARRGGSILQISADENPTIVSVCGNELRAGLDVIVACDLHKHWPPTDRLGYHIASDGLL
jgi:hypothetical protein